MKKSDIYDAISGIDEKYCVDSENFEDIANEFKRVKIRRAGKIISFAACLAVSVIAGVNIHDMDIFDKDGLIDTSYHEESDTVIVEYTKPTTAVSGTDIENLLSKITAATTLPVKEQLSVKISDFSSSDTKTEIRTDYAAAETDTAVINTAHTSEPPAVTTYTKPEIPETSRTSVPVVSTTEITHAATCNTDTSETTKPTDNNSHKPGIVTESKPDNTESTEVTAVTSDSGTETTCTTRSTAKTTKNTGVTSTSDPGDSPQKPAETTNILQQYYICDFENNYYQATNDTIDSSLLVKYLGEAYMSGYDPETGKHNSCIVRVYEVSNISAYYMIAVHFEDRKEFFTCVNCNEYGK